MRFNVCQFFSTDSRVAKGPLPVILSEPVSTFSLRPSRTLAVLTLLYMISLTSSMAAAQGTLPDSARAVLDSVYTLIHEHSLYRNEADWPAIETAFQARVAASAYSSDLRRSARASSPP